MSTIDPKELAALAEAGLRDLDSEKMKNKVRAEVEVVRLRQRLCKVHEYLSHIVLEIEETLPHLRDAKYRRP